MVGGLEVVFLEPDALALAALAVLALGAPDVEVPGLVVLVVLEPGVVFLELGARALEVELLAPEVLRLSVLALATLAVLRQVVVLLGLSVLAQEVPAVLELEVLGVLELGMALPLFSRSPVHLALGPLS